MMIFFNKINKLPEEKLLKDNIQINYLNAMKLDIMED